MSLLAWVTTFCFLILSTLLALSQGTKVRTQYDGVDEPDKDQPERRAGGASWTDFTGANLPDAPVNTVLVDSGTVYVGTDVGVFSRGIGSADWTELGPAS